MAVAHFLLLSSLGLAITTQAQNCSQPVGGDNMSLKGDDIQAVTFPEGTNVTFECNPGYVSAGGSGTIDCTAGSWSLVKLECEMVICVEPPVVVNGIFIPSKESYEYGEVVQYTCERGYTLVGARSLSCSADETFKPDPPTCTRVECPDPDIRNAEWLEGSRPPHGYRSTVTYRCRSGYTMSGSGSLTCELNSQWSPGIPECIKTTGLTYATTTTP